MLPHILTGQSLTVLLDGRSIAIPRSHVQFDQIVENLDDEDAIRGLIDVKQTVSNWSQGAITIDDRVLSYGGKELNTTLTRKIIDFIRDGDERLARPLLNFLDKVMDNPSNRALEGLYDWVAASEMPIHEDGDILAWKIVNGEFLDYFTKSFDHSPGNIVEQPRNFCDEDPDRTCSHGIHFCSFKYLPQYYREDDSRKIMLVKINPRDVVAIPREYQTAKGRCCRMEVIREVPEPEGFFPSRTVYFEDVTVYDDYENEEDDTIQEAFAAGQQWKDNDGEVHEVVFVDDDGLTTVCDGDDYRFDLYGDGVGEDSIWSLEEQVGIKPRTMVELGQKWVARNGEIREVTETNDGSIVRLDSGNWVFADTGRGSRSLFDNDYDLMELFTGLEVGQKWTTRGGANRTITNIRNGIAILDNYPGYNVFADSRRQRVDSETEHDLISRVV